MANPSTWKDIVETQYRELITAFADKQLPVTVVHAWLGFWKHQADRLDRSLGVIASPLTWQGKARKFAEGVRALVASYQGRTDAGIQDADHIRALLIQWADQMDAFRQAAMGSGSDKPLPLPTDISIGQAPSGANGSSPSPGRAPSPPAPGRPAPILPILPVPMPLGPRISASTLILFGIGAALLIKRM